MTWLFVILASVASAHEAATVDIRVTDAGFDPPRVTVLQGDTVRFINQAARDAWPASDIHPTHGIYPAFDPSEGVAPGASWSFRFEKAGLWKFHDHLAPKRVGAVRVREDADFVAAPAEPATARRRFTSALSSPLRVVGRWTRRAFYALFPSRAASALALLDVRALAGNDDALRPWMRLFGGKKLMARLLEQSGGGSLVDCHKEAHALGRLSYELVGTQTFRDGDASCHSGFYHGAMEVMLNERGTENLSATLKDVCDLFPTGFSRFSCLHGIGHGVLAYADYDLPAAIETCATLPTSYDRTSCYGGAFMENIVAGQGNAAVTGHATEWVNGTDPLFPCNALDKNEDVQYQCYQMQTSWMLTQSGYDFTAVAKNCLRAPPAMVAVCFRSFGRDTAGHTLRNVPKIMDLCALAPAEHYGQCVEGALNVIVDFWGDHLEHQATELCRSVQREDMKSRCYAVLRGRLADTVPDAERQREICMGFEEPHRDCAEF